MKKVLSILLALCLIAGCGATVWADESVPEPVAESVVPSAALNDPASALPAIAETDGKVYTIKCSGATANQQYVLLVVTKGADVSDGLDAKDILYIDQTAADDSGNLVFDKIQLRRNVSADVYIGGYDLDSPAHPWYILVAGITASGSIKLVSGDTGAATITVLDISSGEQITEPVETSEGAFTLEGIQAGTYDIRIEKPGYLPVTLKSVELDGDDEIAQVDLSGYTGDVNGDGTVDVRDLGTLVSDFNHKDADSNILVPACDINGDGSVDVRDLGALVSGFNKGSSQKDRQGRPIGVVIDE